MTTSLIAKPKQAVSLLIIVFSIFMLCRFRSVPVSRLWDGWHQLYVYSTDLTESDIYEILIKNGCEGTVSRVNQKVPVLSKLSPIQVQPQDSFLLRRDGFFHDKSGSAMVFYIPDSDSAQLEKSLLEISAFNGTRTGTDGSVSFPWLSPIITVLMFILLLINSSNTRIFVAGSVFPLMLAFSRPVFTVSASASFLIFAVYIFQKFWRRDGFLSILTNSIYFIIPSSSPFLLLIFSSPVNAFFYLVCLASTAAVLFLLLTYEKEIDSKLSFQPVYIRSAKMIPVVGKRGLRMMAFLTLASLILLGIFKFSGNLNSFSQGNERPDLPSPVKTNGELVNFQDFLDWSWETLTFPYRKLNDANTPAHEGESIAITDYEEKDGKIIPVEKQVLVYDSHFKSSITKDLNELDYPAIEKIMLKQGKNTDFGYTKGKTAASERFGAVLLMIFTGIPLLLCLYYIWGRKRYGLSI